MKENEMKKMSTEAEKKERDTKRKEAALHSYGLMMIVDVRQNIY